MTVFCKVIFSYGEVLRVSIAKRKLLQRMRNLTIIIEHAITSMPFWLLRPRYQLFPVSALPHLPIANLVDGVNGRHRGIICEAHEVLTQGVEAVVKVSGGHHLVATAQEVRIGLAHRFLPKAKDVGFEGKFSEKLKTHETVKVVEGLDMIYALCVVPGESG